jgi:hypothetical protein
MQDSMSRSWPWVRFAKSPSRAKTMPHDASIALLPHPDGFVLQNRHLGLRPCRTMRQSHCSPAGWVRFDNIGHRARTCGHGNSIVSYNRRKRTFLA